MNQIKVGILLVMLLVATIVNTSISAEEKSTEFINMNNCTLSRTIELGDIRVRGFGNYDDSYARCTINEDVGEITVPCSGEMITFEIDYDIDGTGAWDFVRALGTVDGIEKGKSGDAGYVGTFRWDIFCEPGTSIHFELYGYVCDLGWNKDCRKEDDSCFFAPACNFVINPTKHETFNTVVDGNDPFTFTLKNEGSTGSGNIQIIGSDSNQFYSSDTGSFSLECDQSMDILIEYKPTESGTHYATLKINGDSPCNSISASLKGKAEPTPPPDFRITFPPKGHVCIFEASLPVGILDTLGVTVVLSSSFVAKVTASSSIDKVKFEIGGQEKTDTSAPFEVSFTGLSSGFTILALEAIGYIENVEEASDSLSTIIYYPLI